MAKNDGGSAYPFDAALLRSATSVGDGIEQRRSARGMSLLDYFAGQALVALGNWVPNDPHTMPGKWPAPAETKRLRAEWAYEQAAAMIEARQKAEQA